MSRIPVVLLVAALAACASPRKTEGQKQVAELTKRISELVVELAKDKPVIEDVIDEHDAIVNVVDGDLIGHYRKFAKGIDRIEAQHERVRNAVAAVRAAATPYFDHWKAENTRIADAELRKTADERLADSRERYASVFRLGDDAREAYEPLIATLRDHRLFWANDLNATSAAALKRDAEKLAAQVEELFGRMDRVVGAVRQYDESVAMRTEPVEPAEPAAE